MINWMLFTFVFSIFKYFQHLKSYMMRQAVISIRLQAMGALR